MTLKERIATRNTTQKFDGINAKVSRDLADKFVDDITATLQSLDNRQFTANRRELVTSIHIYADAIRNGQITVAEATMQYAALLSK